MQIINQLQAEQNGGSARVLCTVRLSLSVKLSTGAQSERASVVATDGPYPKTKEVLGGFALAVV